MPAERHPFITAAFWDELHEMVKEIAHPFAVHCDMAEVSILAGQVVDFIMAAEISDNTAGGAVNATTVLLASLGVVTQRIADAVREKDRRLN